MLGPVVSNWEVCSFVRLTGWTGVWGCTVKEGRWGGGNTFNGLREVSNCAFVMAKLRVVGQEQSSLFEILPVQNQNISARRKHFAAIYGWG